MVTCGISSMSRFAISSRGIPGFWIGLVVGLALVGLICVVV